MTFDIIVTWPKNCDYPLWRQFIKDKRHLFNEVIVAFHETNQGEDYRTFIKNAMFPEHVQFLDAPPVQPGQDWRDVAINSALLHSYNAPWLWFTEQDFIVTGPEFWDDINDNAKKFDALGVFQGDRMHPCCTLLKRTFLNKTRRNFGVVPDKYDHFHLLQEDIMASQSPIYHIERGYRHLNGLSQNMSMLARGEAPNYNVEEFKAWLTASLAVSVPLDDRFIRLAHTIL